MDFSEFTDMVLRYGKALAKEFDARIFLCHVVPSAYMVSSHITPYVDYTTMESQRLNNARDRLEELAEEYGLDENIRVEIGTPADAIERMVTQENFDMVIAATYGGSGLKRYLIGSVTDRLVKTLSCPLLVLHPTETDKVDIAAQKIKLKKILVGCDFSTDSGLAFDYALSLAQEFQTELHLAHVVQRLDEFDPLGPDYAKLRQDGAMGWERSDFPIFESVSKEDIEKHRAEIVSRLEQQLEKMLPEETKSWCSPVTAILEGQPYKALLEYAGKVDADMIVLGVRGHGLLESFLVGSTADRVISQAKCPVLAIRQPEQHADRKEPGETQSGEKKNAMCAGDIMHKDVISVKPDTLITRVVELFLEHRINGLPVVDDERKVTGIICQSDLIVQHKEIPMPPVFSMLDSYIPLASSARRELEIEKMSAITVAQAMEKNPVTANLDTPVSQIAGWMVEDHYYTIPVVDNGKLVGIIGKEDLLKMIL